MLNNLRKSNKGFTIIEVMIVLAIAGMIILVVLLAVPALQRNSRNTAIKNDASAIAAAISEFESNNEGKQPTFIGLNGTSIDIGATSDNQATAKIQAGTTVGSAVGAGTTATAWPTVAGTINVYKGVRCASASSLAVSARGMVVLYVTEASGTKLGSQCIDV